jgi:diacylglycerol kinase (ATP)
VKKKLLFIINPIAGVKRKDHIPQLIAEELQHELFDYELVYTERRGHATEIATAAVQNGFDIVAVAGGDGSVNEVATALTGTRVILAILPFGSGNGLSRCLNNPLQIRKAIQVINGMHVRSIDTASVNGRPFYSLIGVGFDAFVAKVFDYETARGFFTYAWSAIRSLSAYQSFSYTMNCDGIEYSGVAFLINVCNSNQYGYNVKIAPFASPDDGLLDVVLVPDLPKWRAVWLVVKVLLNKHHRSKELVFIKAKKIHLQTTRHAYLQVDGEHSNKERSFNIEMNNAMLQVMVNR